MIHGKRSILNQRSSYSKILILLETTGGILFSLEGFEKNAFYNLKLYAR